MELKTLILVCSLFTLLINGHFGVEGSSHNHHHKKHHKHKHHGNSHSEFGIEKLFVFGDSYADTGNVMEMWKKEPYGITYPGRPAGRYSDGRILTDYVAEYLGLKPPVAYRLRKFQKKKLHYGMNFAFGGAGVFQTLYPRPNITTQIDYFEKLIDQLVYTKCDLEKSLVLVTLSGNDYAAFLARGGNIVDLFLTFIPQVVNQLGMNLERISHLGAKRIAVGSLPPLGCLPVITRMVGYKQCNDIANMMTKHNSLLNDSLANLNQEILATDFGILDLEDTFNSILKNNGDPKEKLKLPTPLKPCCVGVAPNYSCGDVDNNGNKMYTECEDPKSAFFWDNVHPTQAAWHAVFPALEHSLKEISKFS